MSYKTYTILDLAEEFGKDKQVIRRRIAKFKLQSINKDTREYSNDPLEYDYEAYLELANDFCVSKSNTRDTQNDMRINTRQYAENSSKDKLIEVLERELKHSKDKLEKSEQEKENLYKLLSQQQQLSLSDKNKIRVLELEIEEVKELEIEADKRDSDELNKEEKPKWYDIFKRKRQSL